MNEVKDPQKSLIMSVDDDKTIQTIIKRYLTNNGYEMIFANNGAEALQVLEQTKPDLILMDVMMPVMDGYEVCSALQESEDTACIPVVFVTAEGQDQDKARAFAAGAVDYLVKPFTKEALLEKVRTCLEKRSRWRELRQYAAVGDASASSRFHDFKEYVAKRISLPEAMRDQIADAGPLQCYEVFLSAGIPPRQVAKMISEFLDITYVPFMNHEDVRLGVLPTPFCKANFVVPVSADAGKLNFIVANPFDEELLDRMVNTAVADEDSRFLVTEPRNIEFLFLSDCAENSIAHFSKSILDAAVSERASDIHIEPKPDSVVVRYRVDGDLIDMLMLSPAVAIRLISRFKVLAGMDITQQRKPQDGAFSGTMGSRTFKMRLATASTPNGESLVIRLLEPNIKPKSLDELGMASKQVDDLMEITNRNQGLILIVGPTGSGKTTTLYSLLFRMDRGKRSLISVEDPVEYQIPFANQQQVNEKGGVTFDSLLKAAVRQDPDLLFMGEMRDTISAQTAINFASTGRLTLSTLHTFNATNAIFRLQRLGLDSGSIADTVLCIVAQQLLKKLCSHCKSVVPISEKEREMLAPYTLQMPDTVAHPVGCPQCNETGYFGREGLYEIIRFDPTIANMIRSGEPVSEIRATLLRRGDLLMSWHAAEKVRKHLFAPDDVDKVLAEDSDLRQPEAQVAPEPSDVTPGTAACVLLVGNHEDAQMRVSSVLEKDGYQVVEASDGADALLALGKQSFDLILSDIHMPNLDGFKLHEIVIKKDPKALVMFLTASTETKDELQAFEKGAADYIRKPIQEDLLLLKIKRVLGGREPV